jgi:hypothetical protein
VIPAAAAVAAALGLALPACGSGGMNPHVEAARQTSPPFLNQLHSG